MSSAIVEDPTLMSIALSDFTEAHVQDPSETLRTASVELDATPRIIRRAFGLHIRVVTLSDWRSRRVRA